MFLHLLRSDCGISGGAYLELDELRPALAAKLISANCLHHFGLLLRLKTYLAVVHSPFNLLPLFFNLLRCLVVDMGNSFCLLGIHEILLLDLVLIPPKVVHQDQRIIECKAEYFLEALDLLDQLIIKLF